MLEKTVRKLTASKVKYLFIYPCLLGIVFTWFFLKFNVVELQAVGLVFLGVAILSPILLIEGSKPLRIRKK